MIDEISNDQFFVDSDLCRTLKNQPLGFVDVGARDGAHPVIEPLAKFTSVLGFEPNVEEARRLNEASHPWARQKIMSVALGAKLWNATLHECAAPTNSSLLPPNEKLIARYAMTKFQETGQRVVPLYELDRIMMDDEVDFIKIDVQGTEYDVLSGAKSTLGKTVAVLCEVEFMPVYEGQKLFSEVEIFMRGLGFSFYGFHGRGIHHRSRKKIDKRVEQVRERAMWADAVFFRDPFEASTNGLRERKMKALFCCALLLGYHDFALEVAEATWADPEELTWMKELVHSRATIKAGSTASDVDELHAAVTAEPRSSEVIVGRFVDARRDWNDFDDYSEDEKT